MMVGSLPPIIAPFLEELTFRHLLFYKFHKVKILYFVFFIVSSFLFGAMHLNNFQGDFLLTIPYMLVAVFLALVYAKTKNIWYPLGIHFVFNLTNSLLPTILLIFFGGAIG
jgi:membrane protease YdiL (CAAX protease family)